MAQSRFKILLRLGLLLGLPVAVLLGLFGGGLYFGAQNRHAVLSFENEWLGMDVEVPPAPSPSNETKADPAKAEPPSKAEPPAKGDPAPTPPTPAPAKADPAPTPAPVEAPPTPAPAPDPASDPVVPTPAPAPTAVEGDLAARLALPLTVSIKVLADQALVDAHPDWIDYVQRTVTEASLVYQKQFGIRLELTSVGRWGTPTDALDPAALQADLRKVPREAAQVVVGMTGRTLDAGVGEAVEIPGDDSPFNAAHAVVFAGADERAPHARPLLHAVGHVFGAVDISDPQHEAFRAGSWMSGAVVAAGQDPWIDAANRQRILARKDKPFAAEGGG